MTSRKLGIKAARCKSYGSKAFLFKIHRVIAVICTVTVTAFVEIFGMEI